LQIAGLAAKLSKMPEANLEDGAGGAVGQPSLDLAGRLRFSVITPSYRSSQWLRLCIASVADQEGVEHEHIVQDSCSDDETQDWLPQDSRVKAFIEKDRGMYDAINRGFDRATGDVLAYLNCDEQYLPGALREVRSYFAERPLVDAVISDTVVTNGEGNYICHRHSLVPRRNQMWVRFAVLSCALFVRRHVIRDLGIRFDTRWRALGDWHWVYEMVSRGVRFAVLPRVTSVFADTGENLCLTPGALEERRKTWQMAPGWIRRFQLLFIVIYRARLAARGAFVHTPCDYSLYTLSQPDQRVRRQVARPTSFWKNR
jgi:glycosyltransferase involved in cell wall biosynthesis